MLFYINPSTNIGGFLVSIFSPDNPSWYIDGLKSQFNVDFIQVKESFSLIDKFALIFQTSLFVGILGTVPGHELVHRKNKFDLFIGNWLLAFSWDCTFAIEHVQGHHRDVCLDEDPASAKRGENIYLFILRATIQEQKLLQLTMLLVRLQNLAKYL